MYGDSGHNILEVNEEAITYDDSVYEGLNNKGLVRDLQESILIDAAHQLHKRNKITAIALDVFLHSHGLDDYFPQKTISEISLLLEHKNIKTYRNCTLPETLRKIRYATSIKVRNEILKTSKKLYENDV